MLSDNAFFFSCVMLGELPRVQRGKVNHLFHNYVGTGFGCTHSSFLSLLTFSLLPPWAVVGVAHEHGG